MTSALKYKVEPGDVPASKAARRLHLSLSEFNEMLPDLYQRGFPKPDETTGMYDLEAIDAWRRRRNPQLFGTTIPVETTRSDIYESLRGDNG